MLMQNTHLVKGLDPVADAFAGTVASDIVNLQNWGRVRFIIFVGVGATGTSTIKVEASDDVSASNVSAVPFHYRQTLSGDTPGTLTAAAAAGFATTAGSSKIIEVEIDARAINASGYKYARLTAVESVDSPVLGCILIELGDPRYAVEPAATAIV